MAESTLALPKPQPNGVSDTLVKSLVASRVFPEMKNEMQAVTRLHLGRSLGLNDYAALTGLFTSQSGKVTMSANLMAQLIKSYTPPYLKGPKYRYTLTTHTDKLCEADVFEKVEDFTADGKAIYKWQKVGVCSFSEADAVKAQLTTGPNKANYAKYPRNMLFARMVSNMAKFFCPDAFGGQPAYLPDEIPGTGATVDYETLEVVAVNDAPVSASQSKRELMAALIADTATDPAKVLAHYGRESLAVMTDADVDHAIDFLQKKARLPK